MHAHFEWMLTHAYSEDTVRARRIALRRFISWCAERELSDPCAITQPVEIPVHENPPFRDM
jgi:integrase/recombinase XerD